jgi:hypothetical protein
MSVLERRRRENSANDNKKNREKTWGRSEKRIRQNKTKKK